MKTTKFIEATSVTDLTEKVQSAEREEWVFQSMQIGTTRWMGPDGPLDTPVLVAVMQREETAQKQPGTREAFKAAEPFQAPGAFGKASF